MKNKIVYTVSIILLSTTIFLQYGEKPDVILYSIFGYNCGINLHSYPLIKLTTIILLFVSFMLYKQDSQKNNDELQINE